MTTEQATPKRHRKVPGLVKRLREVNLLERIAEIGGKSDIAVLRAERREDLVRNLTFAMFQQGLWGKLDRLRKQFHMGMKLPDRIINAHQRSAFIAMEENR